MRFFGRCPSLFSVGLSCILLAGCGAGNSGSPAPVLPASSLQAVAVGIAPAKAPVDRIFGSDATSGVIEVTLGGKLLRSFATSAGLSEYVAMDDAGNVYDEAFASNAFTFSRFAIGGNVPTATYQPSSQTPVLVSASHAGEVVIAGLSSGGARNFDVWDSGVAGGPPSRSFVRSGMNSTDFAIEPDGSLVIPYINSQNGKLQYDVIPPGATQPSRTIVDTIVPTFSTTFTPNFMVVAADGTLYVGEWSYTTGDPLAGLYVYPKTGSEHVVTAGASAPTGVDVDAAGNVYVCNSNSVFTGSTYSADTLHELTEYSPHAAKLLRRIATGFENPQNMTVSDAGDAYMVDFADANNPSGSLVVVPAAQRTAHVVFAPFSGSNVVLYNGKRVKYARGSISGSGSVGRAATIRHKPV